MSAIPRNLVALYTALGFETFGLVENPLFVSLIDSLEFASPARASGRLWVTFSPTIAAAQFSEIRLHTHRGFWIRELANVGAGDAGVFIGGAATGALTVEDPVTQGVAIGVPDETLYDQTGRTLQNITIGGGGSAGNPLIFDEVHVGRNAGAIGQLCTLPAGQTLRDLWVTASSGIDVQALLANTAIRISLQLEIGAEVFLT